MLLLLCLVSKVVMEVTGLAGLVEAFKEKIGKSVSAMRLEETEVQDHSGRKNADAKARRVHQDDEAHVPVQNTTGVG